MSSYDRLLEALGRDPKKAPQIVRRILDLLREDADDDGKQEVLCQIATQIRFDEPHLSLKILRLALEYDPFHEQTLRTVADVFEALGKKARAEIVRMEIERLRKNSRPSLGEARRTTVHLVTSMMKELVGERGFDEDIPNVFRAATVMPSKFATKEPDFLLSDMAVFSDTKESSS